MGRREQITIRAVADQKALYDNAMKVVFHHPKFIAPILRAVVPEFKDCTVDEVVSYINPKSIGSVPVDSTSAALEAQDGEKNALNEKLIRYDVNFTALNPKLSHGKIHVRLHIDLEVQNNYRADSSLIKRAMYYVARELASQLSVLTEKTNYRDLEKSYSIWICNDNIPKKLRGTVSLYQITKTDLIGTADEPDADYDLMSVIIIRRGGNNDGEIFGYLDALFTANEDRICDYVDIRDDEELMEGVRQMEGLGASIYNSGRSDGLLLGRREGKQEGILLGRREGHREGKQEGLLEGQLRTLAEFVLDGMISISDAARRMNMSEMDFMSAVESIFGPSKRL